MPVGNEEGEIISAALGDKRAILLSHHGMLVAAASVEEACVLALQFERAARMQLLAMAAGKIQPIPPALGREARLDPDAAPLAGGFRLLRAAGAQDASRRVELRLAALQGGGASSARQRFGPASAAGPLGAGALDGQARFGHACLLFSAPRLPMIDLPHRLRTLRRQQALSLEQLAQRTGLTKSYLSKLEEG